MPWSKDNPPRPAKNWPSNAQALCIRVANAALRSGKSEQDAIYACIGAVKSAYPKVIGSGKKNSEFALMFGEGAESALSFSTRFYDISPIQLKEGPNGRKLSEIQVLPEGQFKHPWYGDLDFTAPVLRQVVRNFNNNVLGTDIMVDEGHDRGKALGWYKELHHGTRKVQTDDGEKEFTGLWGAIEWTELGEEFLQKEIYKYFSAEIGSWTGPSGDKVPNVLLGGGLTNRPFFKQMPAVKLAEGTAADRFVIGLFADEAWAFMAGTPDEEDEEHSFDHQFLFSLGEDEEEDENSDEVEMDELIAEINTKYNKTFKTKEEVLVFLGTLHTGEVFDAEKFRTTFGALGVEFKDGEDPITAVAKALQAASNTATQLAGRVTTIEKDLKDERFEKAFSANLRAGKVVPAQKEKMKKLYDSDPQMFSELMEVQPTSGPVFADNSDIGEERGYQGGGDEPGEDGKFKDVASKETQDEAKRYVKLAEGSDHGQRVPNLAAARANGHNREG